MPTKNNNDKKDSQNTDSQNTESLFMEKEVTEHLPIDEHEENVIENGKQVRRRGVYLLPNLFTTGAVFCGFYAIIGAMQGLFIESAMAICIGAVLDGLDGAVARLTNTQSAFGAQYDSMSDLVVFGIAPAVMAYSWATQQLGKLGWLIAFIYLTCAALRLARFNVHIDDPDKRFFTGLPSPASAGLIATFIWLCARSNLEGTIMIAGTASITFFAGLLMISNIAFPSFKEQYIGRVPFAGLLGIIMLLGVVFIDPPSVLFSMAVGYILFGITSTVWKKQSS